MKERPVEQLGFADFSLKIGLLVGSVSAVLTVALLGPRMDRTTVGALAIAVFVTTFLVVPVLMLKKS